MLGRLMISVLPLVALIMWIIWQTWQKQWLLECPLGRTDSQKEEDLSLELKICPLMTHYYVRSVCTLRLEQKIVACITRHYLIQNCRQEYCYYEIWTITQAMCTAATTNGHVRIFSPLPGEAILSLTKRPLFCRRYFQIDLAELRLCSFIQISLISFPIVSFDLKSSLVQVMARRRPGDKPLSEPMMIPVLSWDHKAALSCNKLKNDPVVLWSMGSTKIMVIISRMELELQCLGAVLLECWGNGDLKRFEDERMYSTLKSREHKINYSKSVYASTIRVIFRHFVVKRWHVLVNEVLHTIP